MAGSAAIAAPSFAQGAWPNKPVAILVPFTPGGGTDAFGRPMFAVMGKNMGRQFVIDNKGGAGGTLGAGPALQDLVAGRVDLMFDGLGSSAGHIKAGRISATAVAADKPAPAYPEVPLAKAGGAPNDQTATWHGLWAPKGTPREIVSAMQSELRTALDSDELKSTWTGLGTEKPDLRGDDFGRFVSAETKRRAEVVKASAVMLD